MRGKLIRIVLPGPPRGWQRTGQRIVSMPGRKPFVVNFTRGETRAEEATLRVTASMAMDGHPPMRGPVEVRMVAYRSVPQSWSRKKQAAALRGEILPDVKPDHDNIAKLLDGLKGIVWQDDAQITDFHFWKRYSDTPRTVLEVVRLHPDVPLLGRENEI